MKTVFNFRTKTQANKFAHKLHRHFLLFTRPDDYTVSLYEGIREDKQEIVSKVCERCYKEIMG